MKKFIIFLATFCVPWLLVVLFGQQLVRNGLSTETLTCFTLAFLFTAWSPLISLSSALKDLSERIEKLEGVSK